VSDRQIRGAWEKHDADTWQYGYAQTVHSSQGSEYERVTVFEPTHGERQMLGGDESARFLYTAFTRSKRHLSVQASGA
jgi:exodeoxyribonuclease-5